MSEFFKQIGRAVTGEDGKLSFTELCSCVIFIYLLYALVWHVIENGAIAESISSFTQWVLLFLWGRQGMDIYKQLKK